MAKATPPPAPPVVVVLPPKPATFLRLPTQGARAIFEGFTQADRRIAVVKGQLDMGDLVIAAAAITGPADVTIAAWELDPDQLHALGAAVRDGRIRSLRFLCETGEKGTKSGALASRLFGPERVSFSSTHAKIATLCNERWGLVIRGSMNLRRQGCLEQLEAGHEPEIAAAWLRYAEYPQIRGRFPGEEAPALGRAALAQLPPGGRCFGLTAAFGLPNLLGAALDLVGPADVRAIGYRMAPSLAAAVVEHPNVRSLRVLVSPAFSAKAPEEARELEAALGPERVRLAWSHGRWFTVRGVERAVVVASSGNLNANLRAESWDASDEPDVLAFFEAVHAEAWDPAPPGLSTPRATITRILRGLLRQNGTTSEPPPRRLPPPLPRVAPEPRPLAVARFPPEAGRLPLDPPDLPPPPRPEPPERVPYPPPPPEIPPPPDSPSFSMGQGCHDIAPIDLGPLMKIDPIDLGALARLDPLPLP